MRHFSFKVDLRKKKKKADSSAPEAPPRRAAPADGFELSLDLSSNRRSMDQWPGFQKQLETLPPVSQPAPHWEDLELAQEYIRIYGVTRGKILEAEPGFGSEGKTEVHCFFTPEGAKHLVSRVVSRPNARVTELTLRPSGELTRLYYQNVEGPQQDLTDLFERGLTGLEEDDGRFARHPNYELRFFLFQTDGPVLLEAFKGVCVYDPSTGRVGTFEEES